MASRFAPEGQAIPEFRGYRYPHLERLWQQLCREPRLPQLDRWLSLKLKAERSFGRRDRLFYADALFTAMRYLQGIVLLEKGYQAGVTDWVPFALEQDAAMTTESLWAECQSVPAAAVWFWLLQLLDADNSDTPQEITDVNARQAAFTAAEAQWAEHPSAALVLQGLRPIWQPWLQQRQGVNGWSDAQLARFKIGQNTRPPLWLRVQKPGQAGSVERELSEQGFIVSIDQDAIQVIGQRSIYQTAAYRLGGIEIQDWASQQISRAVDAQPGELVWDACAGGGGKTLAIASRMNNKGSVTATDIREHKLEELKKRAKRAGWFNVRRFGWDASAPLKLPKEVAQRGGFDRILVDAPCSSAGTWRRNPDARWRLSADSVAELQALQTRILDQAAPALRPGGVLVYATCSWLCQENEDQVAAWLARHDHFELVQQALVGHPEVDADTMFYAVLRRMR